MPTVELVDLTTIDLTQVAISAEQVGRYNPQTGLMRQLDHVIWISDDAQIAVGVKQITHDEFWIPYHIPGRPLMPGVLMIESGAQMCSVHYQHCLGDLGFLGFTRCDDTVFRGPVVPGDTLHLVSQQVNFRRRRFTGRVQGMVNGAVVFESTITGMTV